jgi:hypothetical protein
MSHDELVNYLRYLINKYVPSDKREQFESRLLKDDVPVKSILADFNDCSIEPIEEADGALIREIYFYYC